MDTGMDIVFHKIQATSLLSELLRSLRRSLKPEAKFIGLSAI
jgi:hypothetical protein